MKINANVTLTGNNVILVPYRKEHVLLYHSWMVCANSLCVPALFDEPVRGMQGLLPQTALTCIFKMCMVLQQDLNLQEATASEPLTLQVGPCLVYLPLPRLRQVAELTTCCRRSLRCRQAGLKTLTVCNHWYMLCRVLLKAVVPAVQTMCQCKPSSSVSLLSARVHLYLAGPSIA